MTSASDTYSSYSYTYDSLGRVTLIQSNNGGPQVKLFQEFDAAGRRTKLSSQIAVGGGSFVDDFWTGYTYDNLGRLTKLEQNGVTGGHSVHQKRVDFAYNAAGQTTDIDRYWALAGGSSNLAASTDYTYDGIGRLTNLTHAKNATTFAGYTWAFDAHSRVTSMSFTSLVGQNGSSTYTYDNTDQLTATDHSFQTDEANSFNVNGNRTNTGYTTGTNNRLTSDGTFNYTYDNEGNRLTRTRISGTAADDYLTEYAWDHHNRLTKVTFKNNAGAVTKEAVYTYDVFDRRIKKSIDADGAGSAAAVGVEYVYDGGWDIQLAFNGQSSLTNRYLHGPGEDNILADEQFTPTGANQMPTAVGSLLWPLADNLGSVRDIVDSTGSNVVNHITFDAFGKVTSETDSTVNHIGGFQGAERDEESGMQLHDRRFYDPTTGRWIKEDPIGFNAGDTNLARFVGNGPTNFVDFSGLDQAHRWEWHHLFPQAIFDPNKNGGTDILRRNGIFLLDINAQGCGWMVQGKDHRGSVNLATKGVHPEWDQEWKKWLDSNKNRFTEKQLWAKLERMKLKYNLVDVKGESMTGKPAQMSYSDWVTHLARRRKLLASRGGFLAYPWSAGSAKTSSNAGNLGRAMIGGAKNTGRGMFYGGLESNPEAILDPLLDEAESMEETLAGLLGLDPACVISGGRRLILELDRDAWHRATLGLVDDKKTAQDAAAGTKVERPINDAIHRGWRNLWGWFGMPGPAPPLPFVSTPK